MSEAHLHLVRAASFGLALAFALALQRLRPHGRMRGSIRANLGLWAVGAMITGALCGACACTAAGWAARAGVGVLNAGAVSPWLGILAAVVVLDLVSYLWHRANH